MRVAGLQALALLVFPLTGRSDDSRVRVLEIQHTPEGLRVPKDWIHEYPDFSAELPSVGSVAREGWRFEAGKLAHCYEMVFLPVHYGDDGRYVDDPGP